jgi:ATP synthase (E/31 kDa) subunit
MLSCLLLQARQQLGGFPKDKKKYEALLTDLLVQAIIKLKQPAVIVKGRKVQFRLPVSGRPIQAYQGDLSCQQNLTLSNSIHVSSLPERISSAMQVDKDILKGIIEPARKKFSEQSGGDAPTVELDSENFLPPPPGAMRHRGSDAHRDGIYQAQFHLLRWRDHIDSLTCRRRLGA